jgi:hypothetical protein
MQSLPVFVTYNMAFSQLSISVDPTTPFGSYTVSFNVYLNDHVTPKRSQTKSLTFEVVSDCVETVIAGTVYNMVLELLPVSDQR